MPAFLIPALAAAASSAAPAAASLTPSLIAGGAALAGSVINAGSQLGTNSSQLSYSREMYDKQRADALADWTRQNEYNSPKQQMIRFKEAGLNPNMVYGNGVEANSGAMPRQSNLAPSKPEFQAVDPQSTLAQYQNLQQSKQQTDNLRKQAELIDAQKKQVEANTLAITKRTDRTVFDLEKDNYLRSNGMWDWQMDYNQAKLHNMEVGTRFRIDENDRQNLMNETNLKYIVSKMGQIKEQNTLIPFQRELIKAQTKRALQELSFGKNKESDRQKMQYLLQKNQNWQTVLYSRKATEQQIQNVILQLREAAIREGISTEFRENMIKAMIPVVTK